MLLVIVKMVSHNITIYLPLDVVGFLNNNRALSGKFYCVVFSWLGSLKNYSRFKVTIVMMGLIILSKCCYSAKHLKQCWVNF